MSRFIVSLLLLAPLSWAQTEPMADSEPMPENPYHAYFMTSLGMGARFVPNIGDTMLFMPTLNINLGTMLNGKNFVLISAEHEAPLGSLSTTQWFDVGIKLGGLASPNLGVYTYVGSAELMANNLNTTGGPSYGIGSYYKFYNLGMASADAIFEWDLRIMHESKTDRPIYTLGMSISAALF